MKVSKIESEIRKNEAKIVSIWLDKRVLEDELKDLEAKARGLKAKLERAKFKENQLKEVKK